MLSRFPGWSLGCQDSPPPPSFLCLISDPQDVSGGSKKANSTLFPSWGSYSSLIFVLLLLLYSSLRVLGQPKRRSCLCPQTRCKLHGTGVLLQTKIHSPQMHSLSQNEGEKPQHLPSPRTSCCLSLLIARHPSIQDVSAFSILLHVPKPFPEQVISSFTSSLGTETEDKVNLCSVNMFH